MARKKTNETLPSPQSVLDGDVVPDGDYAGLPTDLVLRTLADGLHSIFSGEDGKDESGRQDISRSVTRGRGAEITHAGAALDMVVGEYLEMVRLTEGDHRAKIAALNFCETALPYASLPVPVATSYADALKIKGRRK